MLKHAESLDHQANGYLICGIAAYLLNPLKSPLTPTRTLAREYLGWNQILPSTEEELLGKDTSLEKAWEEESPDSLGQLCLLSWRYTAYG